MWGKIPKETLSLRPLVCNRLNIEGNMLVSVFSKHSSRERNSGEYDWARSFWRIKPYDKSLTTGGGKGKRKKKKKKRQCWEGKVSLETFPPLIPHNLWNRLITVCL